MAPDDPLPGTCEEWSTAPLPAGALPFPRVPLPPLPAKWSAPLADAPPGGVWLRFDQVKIRCLSTMCEANLHCFRLTKSLAQTLGPGSCRACGQPLVSLQRTAARDLADVDATFAALQLECIRHYFWHVPFGQRALDYALRAGWTELDRRIPGRIRSRIGPAHPYADGRQTPISLDKADALDFGLHAVAACCRRCADYWHGIEQGRPLTDAEVDYLAELVRRYLRARLPHLPAAPTRLPRRRRGADGHPLPGPADGEDTRQQIQSHAS